MKRTILILTFFMLYFPVNNILWAQPFEILTPSLGTEESLSTELRSLEAIERDMALEKLNNKYTKTDSFLELGELRYQQGKFEEAERYFLMVLDQEPDNMHANEGLAMIYYNQGYFGKSKAIFDKLMQLYPLSDRLREDFEKVRGKLKTMGDLGLQIREDNRGISEVQTSGEFFFPSFRSTGLSTRFKVENSKMKDSKGELENRLYSTALEYVFNSKSKFSAAFVPEARGGKDEVNGYIFHGVTGAEALNLSLQGGKTGFKENVDTIRLGLFENFATIVLFGELNEKAKISQSFTTSDISDGNSRRHFETDLFYFIYRSGVPLLSLDLKVYQASFERSVDLQGKPYSYWAPSDFRGARAALSWERGIGPRWWWGFEGHYVNNQFRAEGWQRTSETGGGYKFHLSRLLGNGRAYVEFSDSIREYFRERSLSVYGSFDL
ncbi:MAG: hypothetical protein HQM08_03600 [Candidatus Riflebacteria bacterium]|nr:hypothetical protein [Candidatus Riflebacteria bacterium]